MKSNNVNSYALGNRWKETIGFLSVDVAEDVTGGKSIAIPGTCKVLDVIVHAKATSASGAITLRKSTTAISDAIAMDTDGVVSRAGTLNDAESKLLPTDDLNVIAAGATDRGSITILVKWL